MKIKYKILIFIVLFSKELIYSQSIVYEDCIFSPIVKTVQVKDKDWDLSYPFIGFNANQKLLISFDILSSEIRSLSYKLIHCNHDWTKSNLIKSEYLDGFEIQQISEITNSSNTLVDYVHYSFELPNEYLKIKASGNYMLLVFDDNKEDEILFQKKILFYERLISIDNAVVKRASSLELADYWQEIDFSFSFENTPIYDPYSEITVKLMQNGRWDNVISGLKPKFINNYSVDYDLDFDNLFLASKDFRNFNFKNFNYPDVSVKSIKYVENIFKIDLKPEEPLRFKQFNSKDDINGKFFISNGTDSPETEADYAIVRFNLKYDAPEIDGNIYLFGALTNWEINNNSKMSYNIEEKCYEKEILLKQGYYDYTYVFVKNDSSKVDNFYVEGSHYETINDYHILLYYHDKKNSFDRLIALKPLTVNH